MKHFSGIAVILIMLFATNVSATAGLNPSSGRTTRTPAVGASIRWADSALIGTALRFDGYETFVNISNSITLNNSALAGDFWIKAATLTGDWQVILANWGSVYTGQLHFSINPTSQLDLAITTDGDVFVEIADTTEFPIGVWQHVAFSIAENTMELFRNGMPVATGTYAGNLATSYPTTYIGGKPRDFDTLCAFAFRGDIDEAILWSTGRDSTQIAADMDTIYASVQAGMMGYWHFNEGAGRTTFNLVNDTGSTLNNFDFGPGDNGWVTSTIPVATSGGVTDVRTGAPEKPASFQLAQNYPNPFNPSTQIDYAIPTAGDVSLVIHDVLGREVTTLTRGHQEAGRHTARWNAASLASGVYFARLMVTGERGKSVFTKNIKMLLMK